MTAENLPIWALAQIGKKKWAAGLRPVPRPLTKRGTPCPEKMAHKILYAFFFQNSAVFAEFDKVLDKVRDAKNG